MTMTKRELEALFKPLLVKSISHDADSQSWKISLVNSQGVEKCFYELLDEGLSSRLATIKIKDFTCEDFLMFFISKATREGVYSL